MPSNTEVGYLLNMGSKFKYSTQPLWRQQGSTGNWVKIENDRKTIDACLKHLKLTTMATVLNSLAGPQS